MYDFCVSNSVGVVGDFFFLATRFDILFVKFKGFMLQFQNFESKSEDFGAPRS
jgi:hypothetical protein